MCKKLKSGIILIKVKNYSQASKLVKLVSLSPSIKVDVAEHKSLNYTKGVIYCNDLRGISEDEILQELRKQKVVEVKKILKNENKTLSETGLIILTFNSISLPESINVGYEIVTPRIYIPLPLKCHNCFQFGHLSKFCKNKKLCINCGNIDHLEEDETCENPQTCNNCKVNKLSETNHSVNNKRCPIFLKHKEIQAIKTVEKVDNKTALAKYNERHTNSSTYATIARPVTSYKPLIDQPKTTSTNNSPDATNAPGLLTKTTQQPTTKANDNQNEISQLPKTTQTSQLPTTSTAEKVKILPRNTPRRTRNQLKNVGRVAKSRKTNNTKVSQESEDESDCCQMEE